MIDHLEGTLCRKSPEQIVISVGGVAFAVRVPDHSFAAKKVGETVTVVTELVLRQDSITLYGFSSATERQFFALLVGISGIGPKSALGILSHASPGQLADAIVREDISTLTKVKGIGKKGAQRIILELKEKLKALGNEAASQSQLELEPEQAVVQDARDVLLSLGCTEEEADSAVKLASQNVDLNADDASERLVMEALQALGS